MNNHIHSFDILNFPLIEFTTENKIADYIYDKLILSFEENVYNNEYYHKISCYISATIPLIDEQYNKHYILFRLKCT